MMARNLRTASIYLVLLLLPAAQQATPPSLKEQFEAYYKCLTAKNKEYQNMEPEALLLQEGQSIRMDCELCMRPDQDIEDYRVKWRRSLVIATGEEAVKIDGERFMLTPEKVLIMNHVRVDDAGRYFCYARGELEAIYQVDIVRREKRILVVEGKQKGRKPKGNQTLPENNLLLFTTWSSWSRCNRCNKRGERRKVGICTIMKLHQNMTVKPYDVPRLAHYKQGLPCRSTILPRSLATLPKVAGRASETLVGYCWEACPTLPAIKNITDKAGNVIEVVRTGEGFHSIHEGKPSLPPLVKRKTIFEHMGKSLILQCPRADAALKLIRWQKGTQVINAMTIRRRTRGRIKVDVTSRLHIRKLRWRDTAAYSCWVDGFHIATIKVRVIQITNKDYKDYILIAGLLMCVTTLMCIGAKVCLSRKKKSLR